LEKKCGNHEIASAGGAQLLSPDSQVWEPQEMRASPSGAIQTPACSLSDSETQTVSPLRSSASVFW